MFWMSLRAKQDPLRCAWCADEIVVSRAGEVIDRLHADAIVSVTLVHAAGSDSPGEIRAAIFELPDRTVMIDASCAIASRVLFERQDYWSARGCIYWISERLVRWPQTDAQSRWPFAHQAPPPHCQWTAEAAESVLKRCDRSGPHTWGQRKQVRIDRQRPFPARAVDAMPLHTAAH